MIKSPFQAIMNKIKPINCNINEKRKVLIIFLNYCGEAAFLIAAGSLFQRVGAAEEKERAPNVASIFCCGLTVEQCCCLNGDCSQ